MQPNGHSPPAWKSIGITCHSAAAAAPPPPEPRTTCGNADTPNAFPFLGGGGSCASLEAALPRFHVPFSMYQVCRATISASVSAFASQGTTWSPPSCGVAGNQLDGSHYNADLCPVTCSHTMTRADCHPLSCRSLIGLIVPPLQQRRLGRQRRMDNHRRHSSRRDKRWRCFLLLPQAEGGQAEGAQDEGG